MKTMNDYTIYCTKAQTRKAFKLSAPLKIKYSDRYTPTYTEQKYLIHAGTNWCIIPTAEQLIGWLENQGNIDKINVSKNYDEDGVYVWSFDFYNKELYSIGHGGSYNSRKEATLAAIDATLEYLTGKK